MRVTWIKTILSEEDAGNVSGNNSGKDSLRLGLSLLYSLCLQMDVHCFLFTDMLLVCKPMGRKGEKMKLIRQPFVVDRLLCRELSKDSSAFSAVYLNEYGTARWVKIFILWQQHFNNYIENRLHMWYRLCSTVRPCHFIPTVSTN